MNFEDCFDALIGAEGGYVNPKPEDDPGGETKFGISKRSYPHEDIPGMTLDRAKAIYLADFWNVVGCDLLPDTARFDVFDVAVNSGPHEARLLLQQAAKTPADGVIGPNTLAAIAAMNADVLRRRISGARLLFMTDCKNWLPNSRGWAVRIAHNLLRD